MCGSVAKCQIGPDLVRADAGREAGRDAVTRIGDLNRQPRTVIVNACELPAAENWIGPFQVVPPSFAERSLVDPCQLEGMRRAELGDGAVELTIEIILHRRVIGRR